MSGIENRQRLQRGDHAPFSNAIGNAISVTKCGTWALAKDTGLVEAPHKPLRSPFEAPAKPSKVPSKKSGDSVAQVGPKESGKVWLCHSSYL
jgi:hypothetical protein